MQDVDADALMIVTEWNAFRALDQKWGAAAAMRTPLLIDRRTLYHRRDGAGAGLRYRGIGAAEAFFGFQPLERRTLKEHGMAERHEPATPANRTPRAVRPWVIAFAVLVILAAGAILYAFTTRFGQTATPGAAPVGGSRPAS